ncbi:MAG: DNA polymerase III subunit delta' [Pseudomonadota bacterium]
MHSLYPWLEPVFARLIEQHRAGRLPHALLLTGPEGLGKGRLARRLAQAVLCHLPREDGAPCGQCPSCRPFQVGAHPDFTALGPKEESKVIKVEDVRDFTAALYMTSQFGHGKVGIVEPADAMNAASANALLKTLEEPPSGTSIVLITAHPARLPITVRSRCQRWVVPVPERALAVEWLGRQPQAASDDAELLLDLVEGRPLAALDMAAPERLAQRSRWLESLLHLLRAGGNPVALAAAADKAMAPDLIHWTTLLLSDLIRAHRGARPGDGIFLNRDIADLLPSVAARLDARALFSLYDELLKTGGLVNHPLNRDLLLEDLLIRLHRLSGC